MQVESIAECSLGAFCNNFDLHYGIIHLEKTNNFFTFLSSLLRQYTMRKVNKQCLLDTPRTVRVSEKAWQVIVQTSRP